MRLGGLCKMATVILYIIGILYLSVGWFFVIYQIPVAVRVIKRDKWETDFKRILWSSFVLIFFWVIVGWWLLFEEIK